MAPRERTPVVRVHRILQQQVELQEIKFAHTLEEMNLLIYNYRKQIGPKEALAEASKIKKIIDYAKARLLPTKEAHQRTAIREVTEMIRYSMKLQGLHQSVGSYLLKSPELQGLKNRSDKEAFFKKYLLVPAPGGILHRYSGENYPHAVARRKLVSKWRQIELMLAGFIRRRKLWSVIPRKIDRLRLAPTEYSKAKTQNLVDAHNFAMLKLIALTREPAERWAALPKKQRKALNRRKAWRTRGHRMFATEVEDLGDRSLASDMKDKSNAIVLQLAKSLLYTPKAKEYVYPEKHWDLRDRVVNVSKMLFFGSEKVMIASKDAEMPRHITQRVSGLLEWREKKAHEVTQGLNGNNGSATNTDDMALHCVFDDEFDEYGEEICRVGEKPLFEMDICIAPAEELAVKSLPSSTPPQKQPTLKIAGELAVTSIPDSVIRWSTMKDDPFGYQSTIGKWVYLKAKLAKLFLCGIAAALSHLTLSYDHPGHPIFRPRRGLILTALHALPLAYYYFTRESMSRCSHWRHVNCLIEWKVQFTHVDVPKIEGDQRAYIYRSDKLKALPDFKKMVVWRNGVEIMSGVLDLHAVFAYFTPFLGADSKSLRTHVNSQVLAVANSRSMNLPTEMRPEAHSLLQFAILAQTLRRQVFDLN